MRKGGRKYLMMIVAFVGSMLTACEREPVLHLYDMQDVVLDLPVVDLELKIFWDYEIGGIGTYNWTSEWYYGWDETDREIFGELGYTEPSKFELRRYYTGNVPYAPHSIMMADKVEGTHFTGVYNWGYWDILCWNEINTLDGVQNIVFDETSSLDSVTARTNQSMQSSRYQAPRYTRAFYAPEALFAAYEQAIDINEDLEGFAYDEKRNIYVKTLNMMLHPITYIYLTQVILHNNNGRIEGVDGTASLSGMSRTTTLNTGVTGMDAITVAFGTRLKTGRQKSGETVDIVGGRLMTFGMCGVNANKLTSTDELHDPNRHYMDLNMRFNNGIDSTFVFDVTNQVRSRYKGGVITVELDMDTVPIPRHKNGTGFDAVVEDFEDGGTHEFEM